MKGSRNRVLAPVLAQALTAGLIASLSGCGSVALPEAHAYRLELPRATPRDHSVPGVLRVGSLSVAADLGGDALMVAEGPVRVRAYRYHRWAGPLERLLADAVVTGLSRSGCFEQVKDESARGLEDYLLTGRVLDFHQVADDGDWVGRATLDLQLSTAGGELLLQREFSAQIPLDGSEPDALALALSRAVATLVDEVAAAAAASIARAAPPRD